MNSSKRVWEVVPAIKIQCSARRIEPDHSIPALLVAGDEKTVHDWKRTGWRNSRAPSACRTSTRTYVTAAEPSCCGTLKVARSSLTEATT